MTESGTFLGRKLSSNGDKVQQTTPVSQETIEKAVFVGGQNSRWSPKESAILKTNKSVFSPTFSSTYRAFIVFKDIPFNFVAFEPSKETN